MVVAIVLGISITNLLNKLAITLRVGSWGTLWFIVDAGVLLAAANGLRGQSGCNLKPISREIGV